MGKFDIEKFDVTNSVFANSEDDRAWDFIDKAFGVLWNFFAAIGMTFFVLFIAGYCMERFA